MPTAIAYALQLLSALPSLIQAGRDVTALLSHGQATLTAMQTEGRDPTPAEWEALDAQVKALQNELHAD